MELLVDGPQPFVVDVRVDLGRGGRRVPRRLGDRAQVRAAGGEGEACAVKLTPTVRVPIRRPIRAANTAITMAMMMGPKAHSGKPEP